MRYLLNEITCSFYKVSMIINIAASIAIVIVKYFIQFYLKNELFKTCESMKHFYSFLQNKPS